MAEAAAQHSETEAPHLNEAIHSEGMEPVGTVAHEGVAPHTDPKAVGMDATAWVSLAMAVFILILLIKKVPGLIGGALDGRIAQIKAQLEEASKLRAEAEALKAEYEARLAAAAGEAEAMRKSAEHEAATLLEDARANAVALVARRQKMAEDKIGAAERAAVAGIRSKAVNAATGAAAALIAQGHDAQADKLLVDDAIRGLGPSV
ncbi:MULTISPECIES: ATP synthase subunit B [Sphingobium]|uniref:ATP synthase subunit b n=1 Tax=Sphingobium fuliginis ATCC 27551 TaxID=1208342 RepID=A0A5B8CAG6_SPHSA|nr:MULTISPECIES: ATP synthase subunit B [Sphingobium]OAP31407.1 F0F1 ATP synthase subunit B [Sphingobium sp. 20006FA]KXU30895.1 ATP synthase subunit B [Sphingobium sp. AM]KYC30722.1 ATP synthase subunit B [Sphingobium sp. 22B]QDC36408.1 F0F1 ATP synthase subunit B [Sphingobium fuliginis ATCC 27551]UXC91504.1 F0F1 ATP synthase subunit B [Sphingobium sp. RSMS]